MYKKTSLTGPRDAQGRVAAARTSGLVRRMLAGHADGRTWMPPGSAYDPRIYAEPASPESISKMLQELGVAAQNTPSAKMPRRGPLPASPRRLPRMAMQNLVNFLAQKSEGIEDYTWRRDVTDWLSKKRVISPDKLRRLSSALGESWIAAFCEVGYYQHLVVVLGFLLKAQRVRDVAVVAAFAFPWWAITEWNTPQGGVAVLDVFENLLLALPAVEEALTAGGFWKMVPPRVAVVDVTDPTIRCVFRLCDPVEADLSAGGALHYPSVSAADASAYLLRGILQAELHVDLLSMDSLLAVICGEARAEELTSKRGDVQQAATRKGRK